MAQRETTTLSRLKGEVDSEAHKPGQGIKCSVMRQTILYNHICRNTTRLGGE